MKKYLILIFFASIIFLGHEAFAQSFGGRTGGDITGNSSGLCYMMSSYSSSGNSANTPLFNLNVFNQPCFYIEYTNFKNGLQFLFDFIIGASIATAIILFTWGALQGIISTTGYGKADGSKTMKNAIIGLMIVLSTWLVVNTINPDLLNLPMYSSLEKLAKPKNSTPGNPLVNMGNG